MNFIELHLLTREPILINLSYVSNVRPINDIAEIRFISKDSVYVYESYEVVRNIIEAVQGRNV